MRWEEWFTTHATKLPFDLAKQNSLAQESAEFVELEFKSPVRLPLLGHLTELERWMLQILWTESNKVEAAYNLKKLTLIDKCVKDTNIEPSKVNQIDILTLLSGGVPEVWQVLEWAVKNSDTIATILNHDYIREARVNQYRKACILLSARVDFERDWPTELLNSHPSVMDQLIDTLESEMHG